MVPDSHSGWWGGEEKKRLILHKRGIRKKSKTLVTMVLRRIDFLPRPRRLWEPPYGPQVPPERPYMTHIRTHSSLYRNIVIYPTGKNNKKSVLLTVLLYCHSSTLPGYAEVAGHGIQYHSAPTRRSKINKSILTACDKLMRCLHTLNVPCVRVHNIVIIRTMLKRNKLLL